MAQDDPPPTIVLRPGDTVLLRRAGLSALIDALLASGYEVQGPTVRDGAVVPGPVTSVKDLPVGVHDEQAPGRYRVRHGEDGHLFEWAVGPGSWKAEFFPPSRHEWRAVPDGDTFTFHEPIATAAPLAVLGARPCEAVAFGVLDRVLRDGEYRDAHYGARRDATFLVVAECVAPASTCFCTSMNSGPAASGEFDLSLIEVDDERGHRFITRVGSARAAALIASVPFEATDDADESARRRAIEGAVARIDRRLDTEGLPELLARNLEHPRWEEVAERCLSCGNCTLVCPTCFCSDVYDVTGFDGSVTRQRTWASCFDVDHSYVHGGAVRASASSRYRQWMTHKLGTWWDQFDTSGCVGCGRCLTWCPVAIDITEEAAAFRASDGARRELRTRGA